MIKFLLAIYFILLGTKETKADILVLDLNNSTEEIEAIKRARRPRENVYIIPDRNNLSNHCPQGRGDNLSLRLETCLRELARQNINLSGLVISGHYDRSHFYGQNPDGAHIWETNYREIARAFNQYPALKNSITEVYLWACYANRPRAARDWQELFTNADMIAGFDFAGPAQTTIAGPAMLEGILRQYPSYHQNHNTRRFTNWLQNFTGPSGPRQEEHVCYFDITRASVLLRGDQYLSSSIDELITLDENCPEEIIEAMENRYNQCHSGRRNCDEHYLRRLYTDATRYLSDCQNALSPTPNEVLALIQWRHIYRQIQTSLAARIPEAQNLRRDFMRIRDRSDVTRFFARLENYCDTNHCQDVSRLFNQQLISFDGVNVGSLPRLRNNH